MALNLANFKYGPTPSLFLFNFRLFKQLYKFGKKQTRKKYLSNILCWDSNSRPLKQKSSIITT